MKTFTADLHIHTKLSPCAHEEMTPKGIAERALEAGLDIIAICDHNSSRNTEAVIEAAIPFSIVVIPGIEVETQEKIHVVGLFPDVAHALTVSNKIRLALPETDAAYGERIGIQVLMRADGSSCGTEDRALACSSPYSLRSAVELIKGGGGLALAAHVERPSFSVYSQLRDVPRDIPFDALEVSPVDNRPIGVREKFATYGWQLVASSDSHYLNEVGRARSHLMLEEPSFEEIRLALRCKNGRSVSIA
jgi:3',5'-nucleoside bisphosphate phosphatase